MVLRRGVRCWLAGLLALGGVHMAHAAEPREVWIELPSCSQPPYDPAQLSSSLALELGSQGVLVREGSPPGSTHVRVLLASCGADPDALLLRWEAPGAPAHRRELSLHDVPWAARARTLALWISEALRPPRWQGGNAGGDDGGDDGAGVAPDSAPPRTARALAPQPDDPLFDAGLFQRSDPYPRPASLYWNAAMRANWTPRVDLLLYGVGVGIAGTLTSRTEWAFDAAYASGSGKPLGELHEFDWVSLGVGIDYDLASERQLQLGPRLSLAYVEARDEGSSAYDLGESLAMIGGRLRLSPRLRSERVSLDLLLDASYPLRTLATNSAASALPWTAWVLAVGTGLTIEL